LNLADKKQRITPFLFVTCFYAVTAYMFYTKLKINNLIFLILTIVAVLIFLLTLITYFWKISIHGAGIGGILGFMLALGIIFPIPHFAVALSAAIVICGLVAFSRLRLNAHTPTQVYAGIVSGFIFCFLSLYFFV
jgi:membrane-associated phospholipid phosphatase